MPAACASSHLGKLKDNVRILLLCLSSSVMCHVEASGVRDYMHLCIAE